MLSNVNECQRTATNVNERHVRATNGNKRHLLVLKTFLFLKKKRKTYGKEYQRRRTTAASW